MANPNVDTPTGNRDGFLSEINVALKQLLVSALGPTVGAEAHAAAMEYAWVHQDRLVGMSSPVGYLFKVGRSKARKRRRPRVLPQPPPSADFVDFEPRLPGALAALPEKQRIAVFLTVGLGWTAVEVARHLEVSESTVRANAKAGLEKLKRDLGVSDGQ